MIIDCHGHYTTSPAALENWRNLQIANLNTPALGPKTADLKISDDELRHSHLRYHAQLRVLSSQSFPKMNRGVSVVAHTAPSGSKSESPAAPCVLAGSFPRSVRTQPHPHTDTDADTDMDTSFHDMSASFYTRAAIAHTQITITDTSLALLSTQAALLL